MGQVVGGPIAVLVLFSFCVCCTSVRIEHDEKHVESPLASRVLSDAEEQKIDDALMTLLVARNPGTRKLTSDLMGAQASVALGIADDLRALRRSRRKASLTKVQSAAPKKIEEVEGNVPASSNAKKDAARLNVDVAARSKAATHESNSKTASSRRAVAEVEQLHREGETPLNAVKQKPITAKPLASSKHLSQKDEEKAGFVAVDKVEEHTANENADRSRARETATLASIVSQSAAMKSSESTSSVVAEAEKLSDQLRAATASAAEATTLTEKLRDDALLAAKKRGKHARKPRKHSKEAVSAIDEKGNSSSDLALYRDLLLRYEAMRLRRDLQKDAVSTDSKESLLRRLERLELERDIQGTSLADKRRRSAIELNREAIRMRQARKVLLSAGGSDVAPLGADGLRDHGGRKPRSQLEVSADSVGHGEIDDVCVDKDSRCFAWHGAHECTNNRVWMEENCPESCGTCAEEVAYIAMQGKGSNRQMKMRKMHVKELLDVFSETSPPTGRTPSRSARKPAAKETKADEDGVVGGSSGPSAPSPPVTMPATSTLAFAGPARHEPAVANGPPSIALPLDTHSRGPTAAASSAPHPPVATQPDIVSESGVGSVGSKPSPSTPSPSAIVASEELEASSAASSKDTSHQNQHLSATTEPALERRSAATTKLQPDGETVQMVRSESPARQDSAGGAETIKHAKAKKIEKAAAEVPLAKDSRSGNGVEKIKATRGKREPGEEEGAKHVNEEADEDAKENNLGSEDAKLSKEHRQDPNHNNMGPEDTKLLRENQQDAKESTRRLKGTDLLKYRWQQVQSQRHSQEDNQEQDTHAQKGRRIANEEAELVAGLPKAKQKAASTPLEPSVDKRTQREHEGGDVENVTEEAELVKSVVGGEGDKDDNLGLDDKRLFREKGAKDRGSEKLWESSGGQDDEENSRGIKDSKLYRERSPDKHIEKRPKTESSGFVRGRSNHDNREEQIAKHIDEEAEVATSRSEDPLQRDAEHVNRRSVAGQGERETEEPSPANDEGEDKRGHDEREEEEIVMPILKDDKQHGKREILRRKPRSIPKGKRRHKEGEGERLDKRRPREIGKQREAVIPSVVVDTRGRGERDSEADMLAAKSLQNETRGVPDDRNLPLEGTEQSPGVAGPKRAATSPDEKKLSAESPELKAKMKHTEHTSEIEVDPHGKEAKVDTWQVMETEGWIDTATNSTVTKITEDTTVLVGDSPRSKTLMDEVQKKQEERLKELKVQQKNQQKKKHPKTRVAPTPDESKEVLGNGVLEVVNASRVNASNESGSITSIDFAAAEEFDGESKENATEQKLTRKKREKLKQKKRSES